MNELMRELLTWVGDHPNEHFSVWESELVARGVPARDALQTARWLHERGSVDTEMEFNDGGRPFTPLTLTPQGVAELQTMRTPQPSSATTVFNISGNNNQAHTGQGDIKLGGKRGRGHRTAIIRAVITAVAGIIIVALKIWLS